MKAQRCDTSSWDGGHLKRDDLMKMCALFNRRLRRKMETSKKMEEVGG